MQVTPPELKEWLEWAGARLIAMPMRGLRPNNPNVYWPDFSQNLNKFEKVYGNDTPLRANGPSKDEIPIMDLILLLPNSCPNILGRRVLHARALVHPVHGRPLYPWTQIAKLLHSDRRRVKRLWEDSLDIAAERADPDSVCRIAAFFT